MTSYDIYLIAPQLATAAIALMVIIFDLFFKKNKLLPVIAFVGLSIPTAFCLMQLNDLIVSDSSGLVPRSSVFYGSLMVDQFSLFFNFVVLIVTGLVILSSNDYLSRMYNHRAEYFGLMLLSATGMLLLVGATELITIYIALELTTLPLVALAAMLLTAKSTEAGMKFLVIGALSSAVMLYGMTLIFGFTGSTTLSGISEALSVSHYADIPFGSYAVLVGMLLLVVGFGFKLSAVPYQMWVPDVYEGAPTPAVAFLSVASKAAAFALVLRVVCSGFIEVQLEWTILIACLAAASMTIGNLAALVQNNIKRLLGYSTIAHAGYILIGIAAIGGNSSESLFSHMGPSSVLFYLVAYAAANLTALFSIIAIGHNINSDQIDDYSGMFRRSPLIALALVLSLIALIGVPPTGIFMAKIHIFASAIDNHLTWLAVVGVVNSVISVYYYVRVIRVMFLSQTEDQSKIRMSWAPCIALISTSLMTLLIGILPGVILNLAEDAVKVLPNIGYW